MNTIKLTLFTYNIILIILNNCQMEKAYVLCNFN
ncbi:hypothetical protein DESHY_110346 [Desulforamulus hydrothermalis Lam5 = DSM 18033]|uniref:Uncharacterized protein n=1 Tax=Desulforamulus hydrothermalis Lam5 = DSM 18033 TaxID=1121428 RepID=K8DXL3_9FIRM|nr:hypothetical protein DESHY_110346 [Desulforamulus hydrothermalis Lam5 = DSM 18033]